MKVILAVIAVILFSDLCYCGNPTPSPSTSSPTKTASYYEQNNTNKFCVNESTLVFAGNGRVSVVNTILACLNNVMDGLTEPNLWNNQILNISFNVVLNNIVSIDELQNTVTLDFLFFMQWTDDRLSMPALWELLPNGTDVNGIDITYLLSSNLPSGDQIGIWLPNIVFPDATSINTNNQYIRLLGQGTVWWLQNMVITIVNPGFAYQNYPNDKQTILLRFYGFSMFAPKVIFQSDDGTFVSLFNEYGTSEPAIATNSLWIFQGIEASFNQSAAIAPYYTGRPGGFVKIFVQRQSKGIVTRLAIPILLLVVLAVVAFWADPQDRMNTTITLLLSVSALYIVVFQNIPMVGTLTDFDVFILTMFFIMFACSMLHQFIVTLVQKQRQSEWPMRAVYIHLLEFVGRVMVLPVVIGFYMSWFPYTERTGTIVGGSICLAVFGAFVCARELEELVTVLKASMTEIGLKVERLGELSQPEIFLFNVYTYGVYSRSLTHHMYIVSARQREEQQQQQQQKLEQEQEEQQRQRDEDDEDDDDDEEEECAVGVRVSSPLRIVSSRASPSPYPSPSPPSASSSSKEVELRAARKQTHSGRGFEAPL